MRRFTTASYQDHAALLQEACDWIGTLGVRYAGTRLDTYKKLFNQLALCQRSDTLDLFFAEHYTFEEWVNATLESATIIRTYEGLRGVWDADLIRRIKATLRSHELYVLDNADRSGRDFGFELAVAAKFAAKGFAIDFGHDADLRLMLGNVELFVECKRLKSEVKVPRRIKEGLQQLEIRYANVPQPERAAGMLALSVSKVLNPDLKFLLASNAQQLSALAHRHCAAFCDRYRELWLKEVDPRTIGTFVHLDAPAELTADKLLTTCHEQLLDLNETSSEASQSALRAAFEAS